MSLTAFEYVLLWLNKMNTSLTAFGCILLIKINSLHRLLLGRSCSLRLIRHLLLLVALLIKINTSQTAFGYGCVKLIKIDTFLTAFECFKSVTMKKPTLVFVYNCV